jgi:hypothetical protein
MSRSAIALGLTLAGLLISTAAVAAPDDLVLISRGIDGHPGNASFGTTESSGAVMSADGQRIAFDSSAPNMGVTLDGQWQVYVRDLPGGSPILVSRADGPDGAPSDNGGLLAGREAWLGDISADGRYVFFSAVLGDGGYYGYRRDLQLNRTDLVTRQDGPDGAPVQSGGIQYTAGNGRYVAFLASDVIDSHTGTVTSGVYLRDLDSGQTALVSRGTGMAGTPAAGEVTGISPGGRYVAFRSGTPDLTSEPLPTGASVNQVYLRDVRYGTTVLVSRADGAAGAAVPMSYFGFTPVRADGCIVAFDALGTHIASGGPSNGGVQSYVRNLCEGTTRLASRVDGPAGPPAATARFNGGASVEVITYGMSADGRYVLFTATTTNLTPGVSARVPEIYVRDMADGRTTLVSRATGPDGAPDANNTGHFGDAVLTPDARFAAFSSKATNLIAEDTGGMGQVYRRELNVTPAMTQGTGCGMDDPGLGGSATPACPTGGAGDGDDGSAPEPLTPRPVPGATTAPTPGGPASTAPGDVIPPATEPTLVRAPTLRTVRATKSSITLWVDLPATIDVRIAREVVRGKRRTWRAATAPVDAVLAQAGAARVRLPKLARARYRLTIRALGIAGSKSPAVTRTLDLRKKAAR